MQAKTYSILISIFSIALVLSGCVTVMTPVIPTATSTVTTPPTQTSEPPTATPTPIPALTLERCKEQGVEAQCGTLMVFEDRISKTGRKIPIRVAVIPAKSKDGYQKDALFFFSGGPGGSIINSIANYSTIFSTSNMHRDLVFIDQRGVGQSNPLTCTKIDPKLSNAENVKNCLTAIPGDIRFYTTAMSVEDFEEVRADLGYDQINIIGGSYGGTVVQVYLTRHPDHVRSAIIDHSTLLTIPFSNVMARSSQLALDRLFDRCATDAKCHAAYPNLRDEWASLLAAVKESPIVTTLKNPNTGKPFTYDQQTLATFIHSQLFSTTTVMGLPELIHNASVKHDFQRIAKIDLQTIWDTMNQVQPVMHYEIMCFEPWVVGDIETIKKTSPDSYYLQAELASVQEFANNCSLLPNPGPGMDYGPIQGSDVPVLVLVGDLDPQNPIENMEGVEKIWPNARIVLEPGQAHATVSTDCRNILQTVFISDPDRKDLPVDCLEKGIPPFSINQ